MFEGRTFRSGELNTSGQVKKFIDKILKENFADESLYEFRYNDYGESDIFYSKEGD